MAITDWPAALRAAGLQVQEHNGWPNTPRPQGNLAALQGVFWHHDASPAGNSPGALDWIIGAYNGAEPAAQVWVGTRDNPVWHFVGTGYASHAGVVRGSLTSKNTVGVETDWTINEAGGTALFDSLRRGFAAICQVEGRGADFVTFHKVEASPRGRKTDPYFPGTDPYDDSKWDGQLAAERARIQALIDGGRINLPNDGIDWDDIVATATEAQLQQLLDGAEAASWLKRSIQEVSGGFQNLKTTNDTVADIQIKVTPAGPGK